MFKSDNFTPQQFFPYQQIAGRILGEMRQELYRLNYWDRPVFVDYVGTENHLARVEMRHSINCTQVRISIPTRNYTTDWIDYLWSGCAMARVLAE